VNRALERGLGSGQRIGVIVNEFGPISVDDRLIKRQSEDVIELANGCICCTMQRDLLTTLSTLLNMGADLDYVLLETTGLADPQPVMAALMGPELVNMVRLDGVATVVDCQRFDENLEQAEIAYYQIASADVLILNKADVVSDGELDQIEASLRRLNSDAVAVRSVRSAVDLDMLLEMSAPGHSDRLEGLRTVGSVDKFSSTAFSVDRPMPQASFAALTDKRLPVLRAKGFLWCTDTEDQVVFQRIGSTSTIQAEGPWPEGVSPRTEVVLIAKDLDPDLLLEQVAAALETEIAPL